MWSRGCRLARVCRSRWRPEASEDGVRGETSVDVLKKRRLVEHQGRQQNRQIDDRGNEEAFGIVARLGGGDVDAEGEKSHAEESRGAEIGCAGHVQGDGKQRDWDEGEGIEQNLTRSDGKVLVDHWNHSAST